MYVSRHTIQATGLSSFSMPGVEKGWGQPTKGNERYFCQTHMGYT